LEGREGRPFLAVGSAAEQEAQGNQQRRGDGDNRGKPPDTNAATAR
jgi:hypothetical protein